MWVQLHDLLMGMMNRVYAERLGKSIGEIIEIDVDRERAGWGPYLRLKMWVDISKPLICGSLINVLGKQQWVSFK